CCNALTLIEKRPEAFRLLKRNLPALRQGDSICKLIHGDARTFIEHSIAYNQKFDLVDCDPFGSCYELLELVPQLMSSGVFCITTGEIYQIYRGLNRRTGCPDAQAFRGRRAVDWVRECLLPEILFSFGGKVRVLHYYVFPTS